MRRRNRLTVTLSIVAVFLLLVIAAIYLRKKAPPEAARLLPESDGIVYVDLRPLRAATHFDKHPVQHDADYQKFIDATGIQPERDLEEAAFALHRMSDPKGPNGPVAFSEVFVAHFDVHRVAAWLQSQAASTENYAGHEVYNIANDGRTVRVSLLDYDMIAVSNTPSSEQIHSILDRYRTAALPFTGSTVLAKHYTDVPLLSLAWGIGQIGLPFGDGQGRVSVMGMSLPMPQDAVFVASLAWTGKTRLRVEEIAGSDAEAKASVDGMNNLLGLARTVADSPLSNSSTDPSTDSGEAAVAADTRALLDSARVEQKHNRAVLSASVPDELFQHLVAAPSGLASSGSSH